MPSRIRGRRRVVSNGASNRNSLNPPSSIRDEDTSFLVSNTSLSSARIGFPRSVVDDLVLENLSVIRVLIDNDQEPPPSMLKLHAIADQDSGWLMVVDSMISVIPMEDPLGPANITLLLDDCPLATGETITTLKEALNLDASLSVEGRSNPNRHRNIAVVLGCIAEKLAGPRSLPLFTTDTLEYLIANLDPLCNPAVILFSLVALEKFSETSENKLTIQKHLENLRTSGEQASGDGSEELHPIWKLEKKWSGNETDYLKRQVGFCAQWCLDNLFVLEDRPLSYTVEPTSHINVMLNSHDVSEYLKIAPNGLEARCDAASFESVRCTFQVTSGVWYYEVCVITSGIMQIGWATKHSKFLNHEGFGIGDDPFSVAFDGCRQLLWFLASSKLQEIPRWQPGDIMGALIDFEQREIIFSLNGERIPTFKMIFEDLSPDTGFFAAASFMSFQQCRFNFGASEFKYPPQDREFQSFNSHGTLTDHERVIMTRQMKLDQLARHVVKDDACTLCCDEKSSVKIQPCQHEGFCQSCVIQLDSCPMCRGPIEKLEIYSQQSSKTDLSPKGSAQS